MLGVISGHGEMSPAIAKKTATPASRSASLLTPYRPIVFPKPVGMLTWQTSPATRRASTSESRLGPPRDAGAAVRRSVIMPVDSVFMMVCTALVMLMIPALGLFYGGMVRRKNVLAAFQQSFVLLGVVTVQWVVAGYSLAFGPDAFAGICGGAQWFGLGNVGLLPNADVAPLVPHQLFMIFQLMVAVLTAALISGAIAERMKFSSYVCFQPAVDHPGIRPGRALGLGPRRLDSRAGGAGLWRRAGCAPDLRCCGALLCAFRGEAERARHRGHAPAQPHLDGARDRVALVRLAGAQRRPGAGGECRGGRRVRVDQPCRCRRRW